jgi:MinD superfamily P-loop ATPase
LSFEGGTGRTFIARNLFFAAQKSSNIGIQLADFDVHKPDLLAFFGDQIVSSQEIYAPFPVIDVSKCRYCGVCSDFCTEKAIQFSRYVPSVTLIVSRCYACGNCLKACTRNGIRMKNKLSGKIWLGRADGNCFVAASAESSTEFHLPLIKALLQNLETEAAVVCDFGPGNDSLVRAGLGGMDVAVLVLKKNPDWKSGLEKMSELISKAGIPAGLILNFENEDKSYIAEIKAFCSNRNIPLIGLIPVLGNPEREAFLISDESKKELALEFSGIWNRIIELAKVNIKVVEEF